MKDRKSIRVLFVTSEMFPLANTGGLGDVSAALPAALRDLGVDIRVMMPAYPTALARAAKKGKRIPIATPPELGEANLVSARAPDTDVPVWLVECPSLFDRLGGPYGDAAGREWPDNAARFGLLSQAATIVASAASPVAWSPDLVHANDWQSGLVCALLATRREGRPPTVFSIHNLSFLGLFPFKTFAKLGLPAHVFHMHGVEFHREVSFLKAGVYYGDRLTTVSPNYAKEIQTPKFGCGLEGLLAGRARDLVGILNGVDYARWDPLADGHIAAHYSPQSLDGKRECKRALQREMGLEVKGDAFLLGNVGRLTPQKGVDLLLEALPSILDGRVQLALLGSGDAALERAFSAAAKKYPRRVAVRLGYDDPLAHRIEAGADAFVMPSRFEPCGLNQMYSLKYGTPPIVHRVGGLADTVFEGRNGFVFETPAAPALVNAMTRAAMTFAQPAKWRELQTEGMEQDFGWSRAAREYLSVYKSLLKL